MSRSLTGGSNFELPGRGMYEDRGQEIAGGGGVGRGLGEHGAAARWEDLSARAGRNDKPGILAVAIVSGVLSDPHELRVGLEDTWTTCEWPGRAIEYDMWVDLFELAGVDEEHCLHETRLRERSTLPKTVRVFRAAADGHERGLSWTTSFERAHWFATRLGALAGHRHRIFETDAPRDEMLAYFHETRSEHEYLIDTSRIPDGAVREVEPVEWEYLLDQNSA